MCKQQTVTTIDSGDSPDLPNYLRIFTAIANGYTF